MSEDCEVWTRFLEGERPEIYEVWYDVHVGRAVEVPEGGAEYLGAVAAGVSRKRIDVVARVEEGFWVVEVKPFGNMVALGQALGYLGLFVEEFAVGGGVWPVVVCDQVDVDVVSRFGEHGVVVYATGYGVLG